MEAANAATRKPLAAWPSFGQARDDSSGHAVYTNGKKRNTTARAGTAMDSRKDGPAGGWE
jgi:hypothetical protein